MDYLKNKLNNITQTVVSSLVPPPKQSVFLSKGQLTPQEFEQAGDKLINAGGNWRWCKAVNDKCKNKYLPDDKQFLIQENVISFKRIKDLNSNVGLVEQADQDGDIVILNNNVQEKQEISQPEERFYTLYIAYDLYYFTPRLYLSGNVNGRQLTYEEVKEDVSGEYADKTVTNETFVELDGVKLPTIHPCKHADTLKFFTDQMRENGVAEENIHADNSLSIFLKFMNSVIPTIQFDFVSTIALGD